MKEGAIIGAVVALFVYMLLPIYGDNGAQATLFPTANAIASPSGLSNYTGNLPLSMVVFFSLEILGVGVGILSQLVLRNFTKSDLQN